MALFILTLLSHTPAFSMDVDEQNSTSVVKIKSIKKRAKSPAETIPHQYGSNNKKNKSSKIRVSAPTEATPGCYWYSRNNKIKTTDTNVIGKFKGGLLYGYIPQALTNENDQWQTALDKGFVKAAKGANGVKYPEKKLLELKINGNNRLYTTEVHKNASGEYLAIFDRIGNHEKIEKVISKKGKLTVHTDYFYYSQG